MHATFVSALGLASLFTAAFARSLVERQGGADCRNDAVRIGLWENPKIYGDVNTFCNSLLGIPTQTNCVYYETPTSNVYGMVTATSTVTGTTTVPSRTVTVTTTSVEFALRKLAVRAAITQAPYLKDARAAINDDFAKRQAPNAPDYPSSLSSGCRCGPPTPLTTNDVCTADPVTRTVEGFNITTVYKAITAGVTTVTETVNVTTKINTSSTLSSMSHSDWDDWTTSGATTSFEVDPTFSSATEDTTMSTASSTDEISASSSEPVPASTSSRSHPWSSSEQPETTSTTTADYSPSSSWTPESTSTTDDTPSGTSITTTTTASSSTTPTACPEKNGTVFSSNVKDCTEYQYVCGRSYPPSSYYDLATSVGTPEDCTEICDAANAGAETKCVGVVWNAMSSMGVNCRALKNLDNPIDGANSSVALVLTPDADCPTSTTTKPYPSEPTGTQSRSATTPWWSTGTGSKTWVHTYNRTHTRPTSSSKPMWTTTSANVSVTVDANLTSTTTTTPYWNTIMTTSTSYPMSNYSSTVVDANSTSSWTDPASSGTGFPSSTVNATATTCPATTVTEKATVYMSMISYVIETQTARWSKTWEEKTKTVTETASQSQDTVTVTVTAVPTTTEGDGTMDSGGGETGRCARLRGRWAKSSLQ